MKPHRKKAKKLETGEDEALSNAMLLEDTTSSSSEGGDGGEGALRREKGKNKRVAEKLRTKKAFSIPRKKKQGSGSEGSGASVDLLGALIGNPAPARKTDLPTAAQAAPAQQAQGKRPMLLRQHSADAVERRGSGGGESVGSLGLDGRRPPQLARGGSLDTATSSLSLSQYHRGAVLRKDAPGILPNSSSRKPGKSVAGSDVAKPAPIGEAGKKGVGAEHARRGSQTPALMGSANTSINRGTSKLAPTTPVPAPSNKIKDKFEKVTHYRGVYRKKSNGKYFVWVNGAPLDGTPHDT